MKCRILSLESMDNPSYFCIQEFWKETVTNEIKKIMEDKNIKEAGKVVLTDEELMEIVGGTGNQD